MVKRPDNFLADELGRNKSRPLLSYRDGFRFGLGMVIAHLFVLVLVGGLAWGAVVVFHLH